MLVAITHKLDSGGVERLGENIMLRLMGTMARQIDVIDIVELTPDEVVAKINAATVPVVRANAIDAESVFDWADAIQSIRDAWRGKPDKERGVIFSEPVSGQFVVAAINRKSDGQYEFIYDDEQVV